MSDKRRLAANVQPRNIRHWDQNSIFSMFVTTDMFLFSISIIPEDLETSRRDLAFGSVKTRFKAILKKSNFVLGFACGHLSWSFSNQNKL